jgi:hypothetical protein
MREWKPPRPLTEEELDFIENYFEDEPQVAQGLLNALELGRNIHED